MILQVHNKYTGNDRIVGNATMRIPIRVEALRTLGGKQNSMMDNRKTPKQRVVLNDVILPGA